MAANDDNPEGLKLGRRFMVGKYIAGGSFGRLYSGKNIQTGEAVAVKMEKKDTERAQLIFEFAFFRKLNAEAVRHKGIPKIHYFGHCGVWNALVMDLLGPSLEKIHDKCGQKFSLKTTLLIGNQLIEIFEYFHGRGLVYRDTKPENFLFGQSGSDKYSVIHIIDLGLCKEYLDDNGRHIPFIDGKGVCGTVRYMSINNHLGYEQSRRDDMQALGYMLVYFLKGELPWMGVKATNVREKYKKIQKIKERTKPEALCADLPKEFSTYLTEVTKLEFTDEPKYKDYVNLFNKLYTRSGFSKDSVYDFDKNHRSKIQ